MAQSKVVKHQLQDLVLDGRRRQLSLQQIADMCNEQLAGRDQLTKKAIERYIATLDAETAAAAHSEHAAQANATLAVDVAERMNLLDERIRGWMEEVEAAVTPMRGVLWDPYKQEPAPVKEAKDSAAAIAESLEDVFDVLDPATAQQLQDWIRPVSVLIPDWNARTSVARELRETAKTVVDLLERIHNAQQIAAFQEEVVAIIRSIDPDAAQRLMKALRERQSIQRAALLGAG